MATKPIRTGSNLNELHEMMTKKGTRIWENTQVLSFLRIIRISSTLHTE